MPDNNKNPLDIGRRAWPLLRYTLPNIAMFTFMTLYIIVDGIFIASCVGGLALSSLNMVFPIYGIMLAIPLMLAIGGSAVVARLLGEGRRRHAQGIFSMLLLVIFGLALTLTTLGYVFVDDIVRIAGSTDIQTPYGKQYLMSLLGFMPALFLQVAFQTFFVTAGRPSYGLFFVIAAGLSNVALDYIFMVTMGLGVTGAALATGIASCVPALGGLIYFGLRWQRSNLRYRAPQGNLRQLGQICVNGSSEMVTHLSTSVSTYLFNIGFLYYYGEQGVAAFAIIVYFQFLFTSVFFGYSEGVAPVIAFQYGRGDDNVLRSIFKHSIKYIIAIALLSYAISSLGLSTLLPLFTVDNKELYDMSERGFRFFSISFILMGLNVYASAQFTALGNGIVSGIISLGRTLIFLVGSIILLPRLIGGSGLWLAAPLAEFLGLLLSLGLLYGLRHRYAYWPISTSKTVITKEGEDS